MALGDPDPPEPAELAPRVVATAVDAGVQLLLLVPIVVALTVVSLADVDPGTGPLGPNTPAALLVAAVVAPFVHVGYYAWLEGRYAETLGKRLIGLRVVDASGAPLNWRGAVLRNAFRLVDVLPVAYVLGGLVSWYDAENRRLGDVVAQTRVVYRKDHSAASSE